MSCRSPIVYSNPFLLTSPAVPSVGVDRYQLINISEEVVAAVEIDCSSEVDCALLEHQDGVAFLAVGAPALGPLRGPLYVKNWRRVMPYSNDGQGFYAPPLTRSPPRLAVKVHFEAPAVYQCGRAPTYRKGTDFATGAGYQPAGEFPLYGMRVAKLVITNIGSNSLVYKVEGATYPPKGNSGSGESGDPIGYDASPLRSQLVLDAAGTIEHTLAASSQENLTIVDEAYDTLIVSAKNGAGIAVMQMLFTAEGAK